MLKRFASKIRRFRSMPAKEIAYRLNEAFRIERDRLQFHLRLGLERDREFQNLLGSHKGSFKTYLETRAVRNFYSSLNPEYRDAAVDLFKHAMPARAYRGIEEAERLASHRINLLAIRDVALGPTIDWHKDPVSGYHWEKRFWADFDLNHAPPEDAKLVHELNRHQHLPRLGKAYLLTRDERFASEATAQMKSWIDQNGVWQGVNWQSSLEISIRVISWLWTIFMLLPSKAFDESAARRICKSLFLQVDHIYRYPSVYSSPNTHLIGEATAMFIAGLVFADLPRASNWLNKGASTLVDAMNHQVLDDGVYHELSTYYHCYAADFFLQALVLAKMRGFVFPQSCWARVSQMLDFVMHVTRPNGTIPLIGDDDGGRAVAIAADSYTSYADGLCTAAVVFGRPDFKYAAGDFAEETLWLLGPDAYSVFQSLENTPSNRLRYSSPKAGYLIQRSGWGPDDSHLIFDYGGHGSESGGHAHADALSISLSAGPTDLLLDSGTSVYNCAPQWRDFFRSTRAHNTVVVDGVDQSQQAETFKWHSKAATRLLNEIVVDGVEYAAAEHDGYARGPQSIVHRRRLVYIRAHYWIVLDDLLGAGEHTFDFLYHFAPGTKLFIFGDERHGNIECRADVEPSGLHMIMHTTAPIHAEAIAAQLTPIQGWISVRYGERKPAPVFKGTARCQAPLSAMTFVKPRTDTSLHGRRLNVSGGRALASVVHDGPFEDVCVAATDPRAALRVMDFNLSGELFWIRSENGALRQLFAVNATHCSWAGETIFQEKEPISHVRVHLWDDGMVIERGEKEGKVYVRDLRNRQFQRN